MSNSIIANPHEKLNRSSESLPATDIYGRKVIGKDGTFNFLSRSAWKKRKRQPKEGEIPALVVLEAIESRGLPFLAHALKNFYSPVLQELGNDKFLVAKPSEYKDRRQYVYWWEAWSEDQTELLLGKNQKNATTSSAFHLVSSSSSSLSPSPSPLPPFHLSEKRPVESEFGTGKYDTTSIINDREKFDVEIKEREAKTTGKLIYRSVRKHTAYVPVNWEEDLGELEQETFSFLHLMRTYQFVNGLDDNSFIDMSSKSCDQLIPNYRKLITILLKKGIVERTTVLEHPIAGEVERTEMGRAYGYRLAREDYRKARWPKRPITKPSIIKRVEAHENAKYPVQKWLAANNERLEVSDPDEEELKTLADGQEERMRAYQRMLQLIKDKTWKKTFDPFSRRYHNNSTVLKRELRKYLRVNGSPLVEIDIKASQLMFLGLEARDKKVKDVERFLRICEDDLYQFLADKGKCSRAMVKEHLMKRALFSANDSNYQKLRIKKLFDSEFPTMAKFFREMKWKRKSEDNERPWNRLAKMAQSREVNFIVFTVCERIRKERPEMFVTTVHDSILCLPEDGEYVRAIMKDEFGKLRIEPTLEINRLDAD